MVSPIYIQGIIVLATKITTTPFLPKILVTSHLVYNPDRQIVARVQDKSSFLQEMKYEAKGVGAKWKNYSAHWPGRRFGKLLWRKHWKYQFSAQQQKRKVNKIIGDVSSKRERNDHISFFYTAAFYPFHSNAIDLWFLCSSQKFIAMAQTVNMMSTTKIIIP